MLFRVKTYDCEVHADPVTFSGTVIGYVHRNDVCCLIERDPSQGRDPFPRVRVLTRHGVFWVGTIYLEEMPPQRKDNVRFVAKPGDIVATVMEDTIVWPKEGNAIEKLYLNAGEPVVFLGHHEKNMGSFYCLSRHGHGRCVWIAFE